MRIKVVRATEKPGELLKLACNHTMVAKPEAFKEASPELIKFLIEAKHRSVFEHCKITFEISEVSRSLMAQLTRHRAGVFTCQSQHYQDYSGVPAIGTGDKDLDKAILTAYKAYHTAVVYGGVPKEVARQVLPNAASVNILWTVDARNLFDFLEQRLCERNVPEMIAFAGALRVSALEWWPTLFKLSGPYCHRYQCCNQGSMQADLCKEIGIELCN